jgi:predicted DNA-binding WGR domain protein
VKGYQPVGGGGRAAADDMTTRTGRRGRSRQRNGRRRETAAAKTRRLAKPAAKPAAKAKSSGKSTPRYFEFSEGTSNKFWQIWMDGTQVLTKYGRIGAAGSTTVKDFGTDEKATKEYDKLVNEKTKKGYEETDLPDAGDDDE